MSASGAAGTTRTPGQTFALALGIVYLLVGVIGFFVTGLDEFAANTDEALIIFDLNPLHNIVHLALGGAWLAGAGRTAVARQVNIALGAALLLVFVLGLFGLLTWLSIDGAGAPDNYLHLVTGLLSLYIGLTDR